jgi:hypothetical protein
MLEQADRARRLVEQELADTNETLGDQTCTNQAIQAGKMKLDNEMQTLAVSFFCIFSFTFLCICVPYS